MYSLGRGVPNDDRKAAYWYRKAAKQGHSAAQRTLGAVCDALGQMFYYGHGATVDVDPHYIDILL